MKIKNTPINIPDNSSKEFRVINENQIIEDYRKKMEKECEKNLSKFC